VTETESEANAATVEGEKVNQSRVVEMGNSEVAITVVSTCKFGRYTYVRIA